MVLRVATCRLASKRVHWLCCLGFALLLLFGSLLLYYMYTKLKDDSVNDSQPGTTQSALIPCVCPHLLTSASFALVVR